ncbi:MAG: methylenetetrahydrofolate reductase [NAD(P)H] [Bacilli bacterium]|jgi:methylenetetrahydrofolate reductase (NADPH)
MKIEEIFLKKKTTISLEIFPPKKDSTNIDSIFDTIDSLAKLNPDFISVTYGAGGSTSKDTIRIAKYIEEKHNISAVAHFTCIVHSKGDVDEACLELKKNKIKNILALRGDMPQDCTKELSSDFKYASELTEYINTNFKDEFCIGGACYPEVHPEAKSFEEDLANLKKKVDAGAKFLVSQLFFDNEYFYKLVREARKIGITVPILAGIMPVTNIKLINRMTKMCGASIPKALEKVMNKFYEDDDAALELGINYATHQIIDLLANDVDGIHIYSMNRPKIAQAIFDNIPSLLASVMKGD